MYIKCPKVQQSAQSQVYRDVEKAVEMTQLNQRTEVFVKFCECLIKGTLFFVYSPAHIGRSAPFVVLITTVNVDVVC